MTKNFTQSFIQSLKSKEQPYSVTDSNCHGLFVYVGSNKKTYYVKYLDKNKRQKKRKLGEAGDVLTVAQAREMANDIKARVARGEDVAPEKPSEKLTLKNFLDKYEPSYLLICKERSAKKTLDMLRSSLNSFLNVNVDEITPFMIEKWRIERKTAGNKAGTINKRLASLRAALRWGIDNGLLKENPLEHLKRLSERSDAMVRYLTDDERDRLMTALDAREAKMREHRKNHNEWRTESGYDDEPQLTEKFADYLKPIILLSLNTGIRKDNLFTLLWGDIDFDTRIITLRAEETKSSKMLRLPLNSIAFEVLLTWRSQSEKTGVSDLVFPSPKTGGKLDNCDSSWQKLLRDANITNFRWHDMRHDFASRLAMSGVPLIAIKELMGHSDIKTTLIYAHLAPNIKQEAVELLTKGAPNGKVIGRISA